MLSFLDRLAFPRGGRGNGLILTNTATRKSLNSRQILAYDRDVTFGSSFFDYNALMYAFISEHSPTLHDGPPVRLQDWTLLFTIHMMIFLMNIDPGCSTLKRPVYDHSIH